MLSDSFFAKIVKMFNRLMILHSNKIKKPAEKKGKNKIIFVRRLFYFCNLHDLIVFSLNPKCMQA